MIAGVIGKKLVKIQRKNIIRVISQKQIILSQKNRTCTITNSIIIHSAGNYMFKLTIKTLEQGLKYVQS